MAQPMLRIPLTGGSEDPKFVQSAKQSGPLDDVADIRDYLSHAIGGKYKGISDVDIKANYNALASKVGTEKAQKLLTAAFLYNQDTGNSKLAPEDRIKSFYDQHHDPAIADIIGKVKGFGYGAKEGALSSHLRGVTDAVPEAQKILLRIAQK